MSDWVNNNFYSNVLWAKSLSLTTLEQTCLSSILHLTVLGEFFWISKNELMNLVYNIKMFSNYKYVIILKKQIVLLNIINSW